MYKICVVTATRAEYGLLKNTIRLTQEDPELELCLVVTGTHLLAEFGRTISEIEEDGFPIAEQADILLANDTPQSISKSMGLAAISFSEIFQRQTPDCLVVLGDRYELLPICNTALMFQIPIAHISGGELTEGALDDTIRHCITKMSTLHFPACETYRRRIIQMGEAPELVFNYGDPGVENIQKLQLLSKEALAQSLEHPLNRPFALVTFHPVTTECNAGEQLQELLAALSEFPDMDFLITKANADAEGREINQAIDDYVQTHPNCRAFFSLGLLRYLSAMRFCSMVIGNSSSGIVEAPCFHVPTINIGNRQKGRLQADSILNCPPLQQDIVKTMKLAQTEEFLQIASKAVNPYGGGDTSASIVKEIKGFLQKPSTPKSFFDVNFDINN